MALGRFAASPYGLALVASESKKGICLRFVSPALKHFVFPILSGSGLFRSLSGDLPAVVTYHGVFPKGYKVRNAALDGNLVRADSLRRQLTLLKKHYNVISPEEFLQWMVGKFSPPRRSVLLTCDDALRNAMLEMVPILLEENLSCLFFATGASSKERPSMLWYEELYLMLLIADHSVQVDMPEANVRVVDLPPTERHAAWWKLVGQLSQFDWQRRCEFLDQIRSQLELSENWRLQFEEDEILASRFLILNRTGLRQLSEAGMTIGAHSLSHPILARMPEALARHEISRSRAVLEEALGKAVWAFGYPFGDAHTVTKRELLLAEQSGFQCAFMNIGGGFCAKGNRFAWPRVHVTADMSLSEFEAHLSSIYGKVRSKLLGGNELEAVIGI